jgi:hypothetical protein
MDPNESDFDAEDTLEMEAPAPVILMSDPELGFNDLTEAVKFCLRNSF